MHSPQQQIEREIQALAESVREGDAATRGELMCGFLSSLNTIVRRVLRRERGHSALDQWILSEASSIRRTRPNPEVLPVHELAVEVANRLCSLVVDWALSHSERRQWHHRDTVPPLQTVVAVQ